jgi:peroxiredoxin
MRGAMSPRLVRAPGVSIALAARRAAAAAALAILLPSASVAEPESAPRPTRTPLPRFEGPRLDEGTAGTDLFRGRRGLVYVFASSDPDSARIAGIVGRLQKAAEDSNAVILGVNRDPDRQRGLAFVRANDLEFPVIADVNLNVSRKLRIPPGESVVLAVNAEGYLIGGFVGMEEEIPDYEDVAERQLRDLLYLENVDGVKPNLGVLPDAPDVRLVPLEGEPVKLSSMRGHVVVLMMFSPVCPHCHAAMRFLTELADEVGHPDLRIVPVSVVDRRYLVEDMVEEQGVRFAVYMDADFTVQKAYAHGYTVPDIIVVTREGRVFARHQGFSDRIEALLAMEVREALGVKNVLLLEKDGYSGEENCRICHMDQHETWTLTNHAYAFETLVHHGAERDAECLRCHTVGWNETGGYSLESPIDYLQGVQCESCHGRGGPHQSPDFIEDEAGYTPVCVGCHNEKHSLNFHADDRLPLVSHEENEQFTTLSVADRRRLLHQRDRRSRTLFDDADFVGSESCQRCHEVEYETWSESAHARAFASLERKNEHENADCQRCHTTGFEKEGGFPEGGDALLAVGCESCHGPGGDHVPHEEPPPGSILKLADKCDTCVLLQICGSCHDEENDPGFEFKIMDKLELIRHGMTGGESASR